MAILQGGIMQGFSGRVGKVVGARVNGQDTIRAYQPIVNNPKSPAQSKNREILKAATQFVSQNVDRAYRDYAFKGYDKSTGFGSFVASLVSYYRSALGLYFKPIIEGMVSKGISARYDLINGTTFEIEVNGDFTMALGGKTGQRFFGSDVLLNDATLHLVSMSTNFNPNSVPLDFTNSLVFVKTTINTGFPIPAESNTAKVSGLQATNAACGGWTYIYEISTSATLSQELFQAPVVSVPMQFAFVGINSMDSMFLTIEAAPAP